MGEWYEVEERVPVGVWFPMRQRKYKARAGADKAFASLKEKHRLPVRLVHVTPRGREVVDG